MELAGGITGYVLQGDVEDMLQSTVNNSMYKYLHNKEITKTWDIMQHDVSTVWPLSSSISLSSDAWNVDVLLCFDWWVVWLL